TGLNASCMEIYILRDGKEMGPLTREATQTLLKDGSLLMGDFAWCPGMSDWGPLSAILTPASAANAGNSSPEASSPEPRVSEPATEKQKAFFSYLGIAFSPELAKDQAAMLVNDAMEDPKHTERLRQWNDDRLRLHPDLFAAEIQAKKENRANRFFELCQTEGATYFTTITKAHCQVLVGFLDVKFPNWDARETEAAWNYFYPAIAEKFPQLVQKQWRGKFHYAEGPRVSAEMTRKAPTAKLKKTGASPLAAVARGIVFGVLILAVLYAVHLAMQHGAGTGPLAEKPVDSGTAPATEPSSQPQTPSVASVAETAPETQPAPPPASAPPPANSEPASVPVAEPVAMPAPTPPADTPAAPMAMTPSPVAPPPAAPVPSPDPPVPVAPPPATLPAPGTMATLPELPTPPTATLPAAGTEPAPAAAVTKTSLVLTKPIEIPSPYGTIKLPAGTLVKLLARQGSSVKVGYLNNIFTVPATSTDIGEGDGLPPAP
ncbi:MAG: DUF4339 domain-containing protein, partial [Opitutaceae bacterium]